MAHFTPVIANIPVNNAEDLSALIALLGQSRTLERSSGDIEEARKKFAARVVIQHLVRLIRTSPREEWGAVLAQAFHGLPPQFWTEYSVLLLREMFQQGEPAALRAFLRLPLMTPLDVMRSIGSTLKRPMLSELVHFDPYDRLLTAARTEPLATLASVMRIGGLQDDVLIPLLRVIRPVASDEAILATADRYRFTDPRNFGAVRDGINAHDRMEFISRIGHAEHVEVAPGLDPAAHALAHTLRDSRFRRPGSALPSEYSAYVAKYLGKK